MAKSEIDVAVPRWRVAAAAVVITFASGLVRIGLRPLALRIAQHAVRFMFAGMVLR